MRSYPGNRPILARRCAGTLVLVLLATMLITSYSPLLASSSSDEIADEVLQRFGVPGEQVTRCYPVTIEGREYLTYCFTRAGSVHDEDLSRGRFMILTPEQWSQDAITGVVVVRKADGSPEVDRETLYKVFNTLKFGYCCYFGELADACQDPGDFINLVRNLEKSADNLDNDLWQPKMISDRERERYKVALANLFANPAFVSSEMARENSLLPVDQQKWMNSIADGSLTVSRAVDYIEKLANTVYDVNLMRRLQEEGGWLETIITKDDDDNNLLLGKKELNHEQAATVFGAIVKAAEPIPCCLEGCDSVEATLETDDETRELYGRELEGALDDTGKGLGTEKDLCANLGDFLGSIEEDELESQPGSLVEDFCGWLIKRDAGRANIQPAAIMSADLAMNTGSETNASDAIYESYKRIWGKDNIARAAMTDVVYCYRISQAMDEVLKSISGKSKPAAEKGYRYEDIDTFRACYFIKNLALATCYTSLASLVNKENLYESLESASRDMLEPDLAEPTSREELSIIGPDGCRRLVNDLMYTPTVNRAIAQAEARGMGTAQSLCTVLVFDTSGSMGNYVGDVQKMDAAKSAGKQVVGLMRRYSQQQDKAGIPSTDSIALVSFALKANVISGFTQDFDALDKSIDELQPDDFTNMSAGIEEAVKLLQTVPENAHKSIILLSDGKSNQGLSNENIISDLLPQVIKLDAKVYTVGFGEEDLDEPFLKELAEKTGGKYFYANSSWDLENIYIKLRLSSLGDINGEWSEAISQGEEKRVGIVKVPDRTGEMHAVLNWPGTPGTQINLRITDPDGKELNPDEFPNMAMFSDAKPEYIVINNPKAGDWCFDVVGSVIPEGNTHFYLTVSTRALPKEGTGEEKKSSKKWLIILIASIGGALLLGGLFAAFVLVRRRSKSPAPAREAPKERKCPGCGSTLQSDWTRCPYCYVMEEPEPLEPTAPPGAGLAQVPPQPLEPGSPMVIPPAPMGTPQARADDEQYQAGNVCYLDIIEGEGSGGYYVIDTDLVTIGRDPGNHIVLEDDMVSAYHARLYWLEGGFFIEDLDSTNGTVVDLKPVVTAWLVNGSTIGIGDTVFELRMP